MFEAFLGWIGRVTERLRQQQQPWPWAEELGSAGDPGLGHRGPGQRPMQSLVAAWPSKVSHCEAQAKWSYLIIKVKYCSLCKLLSWQWVVTPSWHWQWINRWWWVSENMRWLVCSTIEGETLILVCNDRLIINKLYRPQRFGFGLDDWYKAVKHSDDTFYISVPGRGGLEVLASIWCRGQTVRSCPKTNETVHTKKYCSNRM